MKHCTLCDITKPFEEFNKSKSTSDGCQTKCRACEKVYRERNREKIRARSDTYRSDPEKKAWLKQRQVEWREKNKELIAAMNKRWRDERPPGIEKAQKKEYLKKNREKIRAYHRKWKRDNLDKMRKWHREHAKEKRATDPQFAIRARVTSRIREALVKGHKSASSQALLGCSITEYKIYIESLFVDGMNWEALLRGEIHLDHKIPCCSFNLTDSVQQRECFHYTNTQPLWAEDNHRKVAEDLKMRDKKRLDKAVDSGVSQGNSNPLIT